MVFKISSEIFCERVHFNTVLVSLLLLKYPEIAEGFFRQKYQVKLNSYPWYSLAFVAGTPLSLVPLEKICCRCKFCKYCKFNFSEKIKDCITSQKLGSRDFC